MIQPLAQLSQTVSGWFKFFELYDYTKNLLPHHLREKASEAPAAAEIACPDS